MPPPLFLTHSWFNRETLELCWVSTPELWSPPCRLQPTHQPFVCLKCVSACLCSYPQVLSFFLSSSCLACPLVCIPLLLVLLPLGCISQCGSVCLLSVFLASPHRHSDFYSFSPVSPPLHPPSFFCLFFWSGWVNESLCLALCCNLLIRPFTDYTLHANHVCACLTVCMCIAFVIVDTFVCVAVSGIAARGICWHSAFSTVSSAHCSERHSGVKKKKEKLSATL